jgi:NADPH2:quinone reductase
MAYYTWKHQTKTIHSIFQEGRDR